MVFIELILWKFALIIITLIMAWNRMLTFGIMLWYSSLYITLNLAGSLADFCNLISNLDHWQDETVLWRNLFFWGIKETIQNVYRIVRCISRGFKHTKKVQYVALDLYTRYTSSGIRYKYCQISSRIKVMKLNWLNKCMVYHNLFVIV